MFSGAQPGYPTEAGIDRNAYPFPRVGRLRTLMLFADFSDAPGDEPPNAYFTRIAGPMFDWFTYASYSRFSIDVGFVDRWFRLPHPTTGYNLQPYVDWPARLPLIHDAVVAADPTIDFSGYQLIDIVLPEAAYLGTTPTVGVFPETGIRADGNDRFNVAILGNDTRWTGSSRLIATTLEMLGVPPLNVSAPFAASVVGPWDVMSLEPPGAGPLAWHRWLLGWLDAKQFACLPSAGTLTKTLTPLERPGRGVKAIAVPTGRSAAYVVEVRKPENIDAGLCAQGVLIYRVDARRLPFSGPIRIVNAHAGQPPDGSNAEARCGPLYHAPFDTGPGETSRFRDRYHGITITVLGPTTTGYRIRVTRTQPRGRNS